MEMMNYQSINAGYQEEGLPQYQEDEGPDAPPSYNSIFGESGEDKVSFVRKVIIILMETIILTVSVVLLLSIPITMIVIGAIKLDDCPVEKFIPKWLLITGCFCLPHNLHYLGRQLYNKTNNQDGKNAIKNTLKWILYLFFFAWFIAGSVWVFRTCSDVSYTEGSEHYCDPLVFAFSFWTLMIASLCLGMGCIYYYWPLSLVLRRRAADS
ncbi:transmembrane protein 272-like [Symsagittifera roscoffensis]|uniref:transmembrane protein 272-like n=1 Tax=Symsagittifera roscoffensis TaxID=84072 RepID=UPI00307BFA0E